MEKVCVIFRTSDSVRRGDMDAWVPPGNSYEYWIYKL